MKMAGHVMRLPIERPAKTTITRVPTEGKQGRGRPRETWRKTFLKNLEHAGVTWEEYASVAADRSRWRQLAAAAPCRTGEKKRICDCEVTRWILV